MKKNLPRRSLALASTPQCFPFRDFCKAYEYLKEHPLSPFPTDDAEIYLHYGGRVRIYWMKHPNPKLTTPEDLLFLKNMTGE